MLLTDIHTHRNTPRPGELIVSNIRWMQQELPEKGVENQFFSVGIHPWDAAEASEATFEKLEIAAGSSQVCFVGECGLDKNRDIPYEKQLAVFQKQIEISERVQKPLVIHCVGYFNELFALRKALNPKQIWVIHGFRGKPQLAEQALKLDFRLSFGEHYNPLAVRVTPTDRLLVETDESKKPLAAIYAEIAALKAVDPRELQSGFNLLNC